MKYLVAVSGGVDSVVLLDVLSQSREHELIVAHFDHGIRSDSAADARFVAALARRYGLEFVGTRAELGAGASEEIARRYRYAFLQHQAAKHEATIVTAHHADDVVETIALNLARGTGWRGVAVLDRQQIGRPLLHLTKQQIRDYALEHRLEWVEDSTNGEAVYFRNRLRHLIARQLTGTNKQAILGVWEAQRHLRRAIDTETHQLLGGGESYSRYFLTNIDEAVACELLRAAVLRVSGSGPTRPQCERALLAIKTAKAGTVFEIGGAVRLRFLQRTFIVEAQR
jgi:tRNA(Ile)-lysidine synthase